MRGAWIEIFDRAAERDQRRSLPMRGAWIEIQLYQYLILYHHVAPHAGSVD